MLSFTSAFGINTAMKIFLYLTQCFHLKKKKIEIAILKRRLSILLLGRGRTRRKMNVHGNEFL